MSTARLIASFQTELDKRLNPEGFRREGTDHVGYWHRGEGRSLFLAFGTGIYATTIRLSPAAGVRFDAVEDLFHQSSGFPEDARTDTCTVIAPDRAFFRHPDGRARFIELTEGSAPEAVGQAEAAFREALPFFERFRSLTDIDGALNGSPTARCHYQSLEYFRCAKGLIAAKLVDRPGLSALADAYTRRLKADNNAFYLPRFMRLVSALLGS